MSIFNGQLRYAAQRGDIPAIEECLSKGDDINSTDSEGCTSLLTTVINNHKQAVQLLCEKGANVQLKKPERESLHFNKVFWFNEISQLLKYC